MESKKICAIVQDLLPAYIDKLTKPETTAFVDAHLTDCESCRRVCRDMSGTLPQEAVEAEKVVQRLKTQHYRRVAVGWGIVLAVLLVSQRVSRFIKAASVKLIESVFIFWEMRTNPI